MQSTLSTGLLERRWLILTISLIALSTVLFVTGVVIERGGTVSTPTNSHQHTREEVVLQLKWRISLFLP